MLNTGQSGSCFLFQVGSWQSSLWFLLHCVFYSFFLPVVSILSFLLYLLWSASFWFSGVCLFPFTVCMFSFIWFFCVHFWLYIFSMFSLMYCSYCLYMSSLHWDSFICWAFGIVHYGMPGIMESTLQFIWLWPLSCVNSNLRRSHLLPS